MAKLGSFKPDGLIAGDFPTEAQEIRISGPAEFKRGDVIALNNNANYVLARSSANDGSQRAIGIICDDITVASGSTAVGVMYIKGEFNQRFLRFAGNDTADMHLRRMTEIGLIIRPTRI